MPIKVVCQCGQRFAAKDELAGKNVKCPKCGQPLTIPAAPTPAGKPQQQQAPTPAKPQADDLFGLQAATPRQVVGDPFMNDLLAEAGVTADPNYSGPRCPGCNAPIRPDAVLCVKCGYDVRTGQRLHSHVGPGPGGHGGDAEELIAKAEQEIKERPISSDDNEHGDMLMAFLLTGGLIFGSLILVGLGWLLFRFADTTATSPKGIAILMSMIGLPMFLIGRIWLIVMAFMEDTVQGILVLLCDCYMLIYGFSRLNSVSIPFMMWIIGWGMLTVASLMASLPESTGDDTRAVPPPAIERTAGADEVAPRRLPAIAQETGPAAEYRM